MKRNRIIITQYALSHFLVDFACAFLMFRTVYAADRWYLCLLLYNFCAFALQMPLGLLADRLNRNALVAASGCAMAALAYGFGSNPVLAAVAAGIGNGLFHIGSGIDVLNISTAKIGALGIFVSPGAFGIYLGTKLGKQGGMYAVPVILVLLAAAVFILSFQLVTRRSLVSDNAPVSFETAGPQKAVIAAVCLFLVVCLRSCVGMNINFPWKGIGYWGLVLICAVVLGKAAGGLLADRFGAIRTPAISLVLAAALFLLSAIPLAGVGAVLLFNMTMPVTLWAIARILPGSKGFSFGLLTFGLFLGFVPAYLGFEPVLASNMGLALTAILSIVLLYFGLRRIA
jgi:FSR family fosmidomycin resistance protein-like MFS transporter